MIVRNDREDLEYTGIQYDSTSGKKEKEKNPE